MSSINSFANAGYYQLFNNGGGQSSGTTAQTNSTQSLIQALSGDGTSAASNSNDAYLLSLSPQAQQYLNSTSGNSSANSGDALFKALQATQSSASNSTGGQSFLLSSKQQAAITSILTKYKDAPYTQATFNSIQNDLNSAGLGAATLSLLDQNKSFNAAVVLINALNGGSTASGSTGVASASDEQAKSTAYMQNIISQWKNLSGNSSKDTASSTSATAVAPIGSSSGA